jgi:hypothetical protein
MLLRLQSGPTGDSGPLDAAGIGIVGTFPSPDAQPTNPRTATTMLACHTRLAIVPTLSQLLTPGPQLSSRRARVSSVELQNDVATRP